MQNASNHRKSGDFFLLMRLYGAGAQRLHVSLSDTFAPCTDATRARRICLLVVPWPAKESWTEPEGVACRLYKSGVVLFGVNLGCQKKMERTTKHAG